MNVIWLFSKRFFSLSLIMFIKIWEKNCRFLILHMENMTNEKNYTFLIEIAPSCFYELFSTSRRTGMWVNYFTRFDFIWVILLGLILYESFWSVSFWFNLKAQFSCPIEIGSIWIDPIQSNLIRFVQIQIFWNKTITYGYVL